MSKALLNDARSVFGACITKRVFKLNGLERDEWAARHLTEGTVYSQKISEGKSANQGRDFSYLTGLMLGDLEFTNAGGLRGVIRRSKADQFGEGRLVYGSKRSHDLLRKWLRSKPASSHMVFCAISHVTCLDRAICYRSVNEIIKKAVARVKIPWRPDDRAVSGHSLRVGAAQNLLTRGFDTAVIMRADGWSNSQTLARYLKYAQHNIWD